MREQYLCAIGQVRAKPLRSARAGLLVGDRRSATPPSHPKELLSPKQRSNGADSRRRVRGVGLRGPSRDKFATLGEIRRRPPR